MKVEIFEIIKKRGRKKSIAFFILFSNKKTLLTSLGVDHVS